MKLADYLAQQSITAYRFAKNVGVTPSAVYCWLDGSRTPEATQMRAIIAETSGQVSPNDFFIEDLELP